MWGQSLFILLDQAFWLQALKSICPSNHVNHEILALDRDHFWPDVTKPAFAVSQSK